MLRITAIVIAALIPLTTAAQTAPDTWLPSLQTDTPQAGFDLAIVMARRAVTTTQTDKSVLMAARPVYSTDPASLIDVSGVAALWFATIAEANDHWRSE